MRPILTIILFAFCLTNLSYGDIVYNEAVSGDLNSPDNPSALGAAGLGVNSVTGILFNSNDFDPDSFSFTVAPGMQLVSLSFTSMTGSGVHFFAFNAGPPNTFSGVGNLIATLIDSSAVGVNLLNNTINTFGSGVSGPLGPGTYSVWFQETDGSDHNYSIQMVTAVPEPTSAGFLFVLACTAGLIRRRI